jgi:hypothetical protein
MKNHKKTTIETKNDEVKLISVNSSSGDSQQTTQRTRRRHRSPLDSARAADETPATTGDDEDEDEDSGIIAVTAAAAAAAAAASSLPSTVTTFSSPVAVAVADAATAKDAGADEGDNRCRMVRWTSRASGNSPYASAQQTAVLTNSRRSAGATG